MDDERLVADWQERWSAPVTGWDLTEFDGVVTTSDPPWSYTDLAVAAVEAVGASGSVVDLGTGGGEWLLGLAERLAIGPLGALPADTRATEGWAPNLPLARTALAPLRVEVTAYDAEAGDRMPFPDDRFDVVLDRHEAYSAAEVRRVLRPGGILLTQQVDGRNLDDLARVFGGSAPYPEATLDALAAEARTAGLVVDLAEEWAAPIGFPDVATLVGYLRMMPWQLPDAWSVDTHVEALLGLQREAGEALMFTERRLLLRVRHP